MNRFAELLDRLAYEPGRNNKLRLITAYFREVPDPDRGYALAALTGALSFKHAKPGLIRDCCADVAEASGQLLRFFAGPPLSPALPRKGGGSPVACCAGTANHIES